MTIYFFIFSLLTVTIHCFSSFPTIRPRLWSDWNPKKSYDSFFVSYNNTYLSSPDRFDQVRNWFEKQTSGSKGLLVFAIPFFLSQLQIISSALPFCVDRISQYINPMTILSFVLLSNPSGTNLMRFVSVTSMSIGLVYMLVDTFRYDWTPLSSSGIAVVIGATSLVGREVSTRAVRAGMKVWLVDVDSYALDMLRVDLDGLGVVDSLIVDVHVRSGPTTLVRMLKERGVENLNLLAHCSDYNNNDNDYNNNDNNEYNSKTLLPSALLLSGNPSSHLTQVVTTTRLLLPFLINNNNNPSRLLFVTPSPGKSLQTASSLFLKSLSSSLRRELLPYGVLVTCCSGSIGFRSGSGSIGFRSGFGFGSEKKQEEFGERLWTAIRTGKDCVDVNRYQWLWDLTSCFVLPNPAAIDTMNRFLRRLRDEKESKKSLERFKMITLGKVQTLWDKPMLDYDWIRKWLRLPEKKRLDDDEEEEEVYDDNQQQQHDDDDDDDEVNEEEQQQEVKKEEEEENNNNNNNNNSEQIESSSVCSESSNIIIEDNNNYNSDEEKSTIKNVNKNNNNYKDDDVIVFKENQANSEQQQQDEEGLS